MKKLLKHDCINVIQSIKKYYKLGNEHDTHTDVDKLFNVKKPKHVVLMCLDGLGYSFLDKTPFLKSKIYEKIDTVYPPTTACATISLQTGLYPCEHGWIGWAQYFKEYDATIELFSGLNYKTGEFENPSLVTKDIQFKRFYDEINNSKSFYPNFDPNGYENLEDMFKANLEHINSNENSFSYLYWSEPDHILHVDGSNGDLTMKTLTQIDGLVEKYFNNLNDTLVIITADHGHIDCTGLLLSDYPNLTKCFKRNPSIEPRCVNVFIKDGMNDEFLKEFKAFNEHFDLYTKEEFLNSNFFNKGVHHFKINEFLGDYILIATGKYFFYGHKPIKPDEQVIMFKSAHAGGTSLEMEIPLIIIG